MFCFGLCVCDVQIMIFLDFCLVLCVNMPCVLCKVIMFFFFQLFVCTSVVGCYILVFYGFLFVDLFCVGGGEQKKKE